MVISMLKIRRPLGRLIFNMGIAIPGKTVFLIETAPRFNLRSHVMLNIMVLPHSNAESERVFSVVRKNSTVFRPNASRALLQSVLVMKTSDFNSGVPCYKHSYEAKFLKQAKSATYVGFEEQPTSSCFDQLTSLMKGVNPQ